MKKFIISLISIFLYSCNDYPWGKISSANYGIYYLTQIENKNNGKKVDYTVENDFPKIHILGEKIIFYKTKVEFASYSSSLNTTLTSSSSKTRPENRDFYYILTDNITNKMYSLKTTGKWPSKTERKIETSNLIEGQYDVSKDTLIYRYNDAGCCL